MADNAIGASDGTVYEDTLSHSMDIPVSKPEGTRQPLQVTVHPRSKETNPIAENTADTETPGGNEGMPKDFDPTQIDPYAQQTANYALSRKQTSKDILYSQVPDIFKPEERENMVRDFTTSPTVNDKIAVATGIAAKTALDVGGFVGPAAKVLAGGSKMLGVFGGVGAKWSMEELKNLIKAQTMKNSLRRPDSEIFKHTGWYVDEDSLWKTVMPTGKANLNKKMFNYEPPGQIEGDGWQSIESAGGYTPIINGQKKLSDIYTNPELFKLYPELKDVNIAYTPKALPGTGSYNEGTNTISFAPRARNLNDFMDTVHHEIQHVIQGIENWPRGSSGLMMTRHPDYLAYQSKRDFVHESEDLIADKITDKTGLPKFSVKESGKAAIGNLTSSYSMLHFIKKYGFDRIEKSLAGEKVPELDFLEGYKEAVQLYKEHPELYNLAKTYKIALDYVTNNKVDPFYLYLKTRGEVEARNAARYGSKSLAEKKRLQAQGISPRDLAKDIIPENERVNSVKGPEVVSEQTEKPYKPYKPTNLDEGAHNTLKENPDYYLPFLRGRLTAGKSVRDMAKELKVNEIDLQVAVNTLAKEIAKPEKVTDAAIRLGGRVWTGQMHFDAFNKALEEGSTSLKDLYTKSEQGFMTNNGRFISREEAADLGKKPKKLD